MSANWPESEYLVNDRHRFILCPIPKVASSSLKQWFLTTIGYRPGAPEWPTRPHMFLSEWNRSTRAEPPDDYSRVAFVRDPGRRLVSAFLQKFIVRWDVAESPARPVIRAVCTQAGRPIDYEAGISFREFVRWLAPADPMRLDVHWRPQHLFFGCRQPDLVGKVESFDRDLTAICRRLGTKRCDRFETLRLKYETISLEDASDWTAGDLRRRAAFPNWSSFFDDEIAALVARRYAEDYARFGYSLPNFKRVDCRLDECDGTKEWTLATGMTPA